jgi:hypothetical protein
LRRWLRLPAFLWIDSRLTTGRWHLGNCILALRFARLRGWLNLPPGFLILARSLVFEILLIVASLYFSGPFGAVQGFTTTNSFRQWRPGDDFPNRNWRESLTGCFLDRGHTGPRVINNALPCSFDVACFATEISDAPRPVKNPSIIDDERGRAKPIMKVMHTGEHKK